MRRSLTELVEELARSDESAARSIPSALSGRVVVSRRSGALSGVVVTIVLLSLEATAPTDAEVKKLVCLVENAGRVHSGSTMFDTEIL